ncbi:hypothetical protein DMENIID0001_099350 [Sergentomyia squamirostris]
MPAGGNTGSHPVNIFRGEEKWWETVRGMAFGEQDHHWKAIVMPITCPAAFQSCQWGVDSVAWALQQHKEEELH